MVNTPEEIRQIKMDKSHDFWQSFFDMKHVIIEYHRLRRENKMFDFYERWFMGAAGVEIP